MYLLVWCCLSELGNNFRQIILLIILPFGNNISLNLIYLNKPESFLLSREKGEREKRKNNIQLKDKNKYNIILHITNKYNNTLKYRKMIYV